ncbi:Rne/Rng family ribonuclease [Desulfoprunum benzoelyticum]|uniref:Ribonuclease G n=1 Tax=Desulfoprunum benzoelyticum TaxID=1506996 RepID=A0A840UU32_9BACT|nr:Rne/Rng family ribonuclease [Desulfoprunum benzoelyticum]MBB5349195.1 ribonuclease E [Desulfoprunum benzoelyticum]MBM9530568.1 Rne/Rng family ribonuclease [Desulfoprunum benzoelyticum]
MTAKKKTEEPSGEVPAKATTGAWWKSTGVDERETAQVAEEAEGQKIDGEKKPQPARRSGRKKAAPPVKIDDADQDAAVPVEVEAVEKPKRKRAVKKKTESEGDRAEAAAAPVEALEQESASDNTSGGEKVEAVAEIPAIVGPSGEQAAIPKAARKRSPRKKRPLPEPDAAESVEDQTGTDAESGLQAGTNLEIESGPEIETVSEGETSPGDAAGGNEGTEGQEIPLPRADEKKAGSRRSRRGRRSKRKDGDAPELPRKDAAADADSEVPVVVPGEGAQPSRGRGRVQDDEDVEVEDIDDTFVEDEEDDDSFIEEEHLPENIRKPVCKLLINAEEPEECRLALLEDGRLESIHVSTINRTQTRNNIYKARIVAIEPNLQAAFVDYGTEKNGFLPFSEIHPEYFKQDLSGETKRLVEAQSWKKLSITDVVDKGQEVLVQVVKEEVGKKGANMTTYLSLPGRCVVLMPGSDSSGISRKISGEEKRSQLREAMNSIDIPEGIGWIVRTASVDITEEILARDVTYLLRLWDEIKRKGQELEGVGLVYEEQHSILRFLREHFDPSIEEILVDDRAALEQVKEFVELLPAEQRKVRVRLHKGARPIFNQYSVEDQIESIYQSRVNLPSGGSIVIDPTEALVAIDVNSGSTSKGKNFEASIFQANMEAASELARQLRLRDLGGLIVVDFIDMRSKKNIRDVERQVKLSMKKDKAKVDMSRISKFGLMQISRQKLGAPIEAGNYRVCEHCKGRGMVRSVETLALFYLRRIQTGASRKNVVKVECHFPLDVAHYLLNNKRHEVQELEHKYSTEVMITAETSMKPADNEILFHRAEKEPVAKNQA